MSYTMETVLINCRCGHTEATHLPAITQNVPGYPNGLSYFINTCISCGATYPDLTVAKFELKSKIRV